jgi:hypothetical protein
MIIFWCHHILSTDTFQAGLCLNRTICDEYVFRGVFKTLNLGTFPTDRQERNRLGWALMVWIGILTVIEGADEEGVLGPML